MTDLTHTAADDTLLSSFSYELDGVGNRTQVVETLAQPGTGVTTTTITYDYDPLQRLIDADYSSGGRFQYVYDGVGNMTAVTATITSTVVTTKTYDAANRLLTVTTGGAVRTLDWSDTGELLRDGDPSAGSGQANTYEWNAAGRLVSATVDGVVSRYAYLGDGGRISMTVGSEVTTYTLDLAAPLVQVLVAHEASESTTYLYGIARIGEYDSEWRYHLADHLGSVRSLVGVDGGVEGARAYQPYGVLLSAAGSASSVYGFTGEQTDPTGLVYLRARYYSPNLLQFTRRDAWPGDNYSPLTLHKFLYSLGNPVNYYDPSGMFPTPPVRLPPPPPCVTDCAMFVAQVRSAIKAIQDARKCDDFLKIFTKEEDLVVDFLANYYSGIPFTWHGLYLPVPQESTFQPGDPDRWQVPRWDQQETPEFSWDHPINQPGSELGQTMRRSYGFKRPYFEQTHHYFAFLKFAYYLGGPPVEQWHKQQEIDRQLVPALKEWRKHPGEPNYTEWYAWMYRESVYDLFIVDEAVQVARAIDIIGVDVIPSVLATWCAINEADVWSLESLVDQFYFDFPREYWPDKQYWPRR